MGTDKIMRKAPRQKRSRERVEHILNTAERLFAEQGYDNTTTNAIAEAAGVPVGSLYQFFPNREALRDALVARYLAQMAQNKDAASLLHLPVSGVIRHMIESTLTFAQAHAGFRTMFISQFAPQAMHDMVVGNIDRMLQARFPTLPDDVRRQTAVMGVAIVKGTMYLNADDGMTPEAVLDETCRALIAYLRAVLIKEQLPVPTDIA
jgi:AcrR family transcriptional regulator